MIDQQVVEEHLHQYFREMGDDHFYVVRTELKGGNRIEVEIDHDEEPIDLECIVRVNRYLEEQLSPEIEDYELEVSSAGLTSPLTQPRRFRKFVGKELEVLLKSGVKEEGLLKEVSEEGIVLVVERKEKPEGARRKVVVQRELDIKYGEIKRATYLLRF